MPHSLFLGSHLATQNRVSKESLAQIKPLSDKAPGRESTQTISRRELLRCLARAIWRSFKSLFIVSRIELEEPNARPKSHEHRENNALEFVQSHLYHGMVDVVVSLLGFAVIINAL